MSGWGRFSTLVAAGVLASLGCGGRTGDLYNGPVDGNDFAGESGQGGSGPTTAGRGGFGGSVVSGGSGPIVGGAYPTMGGYPTVGGYGGAFVSGGYGGTITFGGFGANPTGGAPFGGYGGIASGGVPFGGYGGAIVIGGGGGAFPIGGQGGLASCGECLLEACSAPLTQCLQDFGCISILSCVQATGCQAFQCYSPDYCRATIDEWGGPAGPSMGALLQTLSCAVGSGCQCN
jgi:hypothetical protein